MASKPSQNRPLDWVWSCGICKADHALKTCNKFIRATGYERYDIVQKMRYCYICLARSHRAHDCISDFGCRVCTKRHNTMLHDAPQLKDRQQIERTKTSSATKDDKKQIGKNKSSERPKTSDANKNVLKNTGAIPKVQPPKLQSTASKISPKPIEKPIKESSSSKVDRVEKSSSRMDLVNIEKPKFSWTKVFIPTATLKITHKKMDIWYPVRAVINQSLSVSRVSKSCVQKLILPSKQINGFQFAKFEIKARTEKHRWVRELKALITEDLPKRPYSGPMSKHPETDFADDTLADLEPGANTPIDIELGSDIFPTIRRDGALETDVGDVVAFKTALGYVFAGPTEDLNLK